MHLKSGPDQRHAALHVMSLLVAKVSLKAYNVPACYKNNLETNERTLECLSLKCPLFVIKYRHACQQSVP